MTVKLLTEHQLEFLSLRGGCTGLSESTHVKMPHCWKSHVTAQLYKIKLVKGQINDLDLCCSKNRIYLGLVWNGLKPNFLI